MSKDSLRQDQICLNCQAEVTQRYCPNCGQENTEVRKTFYHLFVHFFEDLTHYDSAFWKTIFYLFFKPAVLTKSYLSGKRLAFLRPVRLYIFISFITFFLISLFPHAVSIEKSPVTPPKTDLVIPTIDSLHIKEKSIDGLTKVGLLSQDNNDTIKKILNQIKGLDKKEVADFGYKSISELDSLQQKQSAKTKKLSATEYWFLKKWLTVKDDYTNAQIMDKFIFSFTSNLPKVVFMYMPIFAFILWLFHDKKRWYYFDHSVFTLHYFSFILLLILVLFFVDKFILWFGISPITDWLRFGFKTAGLFWMVYYYFPAHRRLYGQPIVKSFFKSIAIISINVVLLTLLTVLFALFTYMNM
jgi:hypothetical protein